LFDNERRLAMNVISEWHTILSRVVEDHQVDQHLLTHAVNFHGTNDKVTVWYEWRGIYNLYTLCLLEGGLYHLYKKAIQNKQGYDDMGKVQWQGNQYEIVTDLRLGRNGYFPNRDEYPYSLPDVVDEMSDEIDRWLGEFVFSDEYSECSCCYEVVRTTHDCYEWQPDFIIIEEGIIHKDCLEDSDIEDYLAINEGKPIPDWLIHKSGKLTRVMKPKDQWRREDVEEHFEYQNGWYGGQTDDPERIIERLHQKMVSVWFEYSNGQFDTTFYPLVSGDQHDRAQSLLSGFNPGQGWDIAEEFPKVMWGEHSDHLHVKTRTITHKQFIEGDWDKDVDNG